MNAVSCEAPILGHKIEVRDGRNADAMEPATQSGLHRTRTLLGCIRKRWRCNTSSLTSSSVAGPLEPPLVSSTIPAYFTNEILGNHSVRPALICRNERNGLHAGPPSHNLGRTSHLAWDFEEFSRHIDALAMGLLDLGVAKGDRVGVIMGNNRWGKRCWWTAHYC